MRVSTITEEDIPALTKLVNSAYRGEISRAGWTTEADLLDGTRTDEESLTADFLDPQVVILKLTEGTMLRGAVQLKREGVTLHLGMLSVLPIEQSRGFGKKLVLAAQEYALAQGFVAIKIAVLSTRVELIAWYKRLGFIPIPGRFPFDFEPQFGIPRFPLEFIVMEKAIPLSA